MRFDNACFFKSYFRQRIAQYIHVVVPNVGDDA